MSTTKTIGGNRLGAGKKNTVSLHNYERSSHDLSYIWRSTMSAGTLVPFMSELALPGDTFDIDLNCDIKTHPTVGPLFGSYKVQLDVFQIPIRLYNPLLHNNAAKIGLKMSDVKLPQLLLQANANEDPTDTNQVNPSCILSYLNIRGVGRPQTKNEGVIHREFNAIPYLGYWDIYKNYYANKQEEIGAVIHSPITTNEGVTSIKYQLDDNAPEITVAQSPLTNGDIAVVAGTGELYITYDISQDVSMADIYLQTTNGDLPVLDVFTFYEGGGDTGHWWMKPSKITTTIKAWGYKHQFDAEVQKPVVQTFPLENLDTMREQFLGVPFTAGVTGGGIINSTTIAPLGYPLEITTDGKYSAAKQNQEGLALKTYQSDLFNNWMKTEWIDGENGINAIASVDTSNGNFTVDSLNLAKKVYDMLNRIAISGGTYQDWLESAYSHQTYFQASTPMYMGGLSKELVFQEVVSNAAAETSADGVQPLGQLAGRGVMAGKHKGGHVVIKVDEPSYIMGIISLTPRVDYSQGNKWDVNLRTMDDLHKPALDQIGFQDLITDQMAYWDTIVTNNTNEEGINWIYKSAGKQPAWINYMTNVNQTRGNFAIPDNEMFMTLNRRYEQDLNGIKDLTTYIDPSKFNFIFAETALDSQNFWSQIAVNITARRKMSAKVMPNL